MILLKKFERKWKTQETLHQLKDTLMRYGVDLTTPLSRIDKDYVPEQWNEGDGAALIRFKYNCNNLNSDTKKFEYQKVLNQRAWQRLTTQAKDIKISDNFLDGTVNRANDRIKTIITQEQEFINFCGTCLLDAGYISFNEYGRELKGDWTLSEIMKHRGNYNWITATFNNEVKDHKDWDIDNKSLGRRPTIFVRDGEGYYNRQDQPTTLKVAGHLILDESFTPKMLLKGLQGKNTTGEMNVKKFCFAAGLRSSITWDAYAIGLDDDKEFVWEMFLGRNKNAKLTHSGILCSFILKNSELKDFIKHVVDGQMKDYMSAVREVRKVQVKQTASEWKC